jgi:hypothetical protein
MTEIKQKIYPTIRVTQDDVKTLISAKWEFDRISQDIVVERESIPSLIEAIAPGYGKTEWISVEDRLPIVGDVVDIYGYFHAYRENFPKGEIKQTVVRGVIYYGKKSINGEKKSHWFGGWKVDEENECITHWMQLPTPPESNQPKK